MRASATPAAQYVQIENQQRHRDRKDAVAQCRKALDIAPLDQVVQSRHNSSPPLSAVDAYDGVCMTFTERSATVPSSKMTSPKAIQSRTGCLSVKGRMSGRA